MKSSLVKILLTDEIKTISEIEEIDGVELYYMSDGTSYEKNQLSFQFEQSIDNIENIISNTLTKKNNRNTSLDDGMINFINDVMEFSENHRRKKIKKQNKTTTKQFKIFGWTITLTKSN
jgi:hypothetical protein